MGLDSPLHALKIKPCKGWIYFAVRFKLLKVRQANSESLPLKQTNKETFGMRNTSSRFEVAFAVHH